MAEGTFDPLHVLAELHARRVRYVVVGDLAAVAHGSTVAPDRLEVCVSVDEPDVERLGAVLQLLDAERDDSVSDEHRAVFRTAAGTVECIEIPEAGGFDALESRAEVLDLGHGLVARVASAYDVAGQLLADDDLVGAIRNAALATSGAEAEPEPIGPALGTSRRAGWRQLRRVASDGDRRRSADRG